MSSTPRHPIRLSVYTSDGVYYPREITEANGKLYLIDDDGSVVELNKTAVTKITDAAGTTIGSVDPTTGGTVAIPNASTTKRGLVVFGTSTGKAPGTASAGSSDSVARADHVHPVQTSVSGNAGTATKLANAINVGFSGVTGDSFEFDGTTDVTLKITAVPASIVSGLATVGTSGKYSDLSGLPTIYQPATTAPKAAGTAAVGTGTTFARADHVHPAQTTVSGNAGSATKLATARTITVSGVTATGASFDGSGDATIAITAVPASIVSGLATVATSGKYSDLSGLPTIYGPSSTTPKAAGTAAVGTGTTFARADHVHPAQTTVSGNAGTATKLKSAVTIGLSGVTATAQEFDGSEDVTIPITAVPASIVSGLATVATSGKYSDLSGLPTIYGPSSTTPKAAGTAAVGTGTTFARADHVHPAQTTITGNAGSATKLASAVNIKLSGGATGTGSFDGSGDTTINVTALDGSKITGTIPLASIPKGAQERLIVVADDTARLALTSSGAQNGDVVKVESTGIMYYIVDDTAMGSEDAFSVFTAGAASSVAWSGITGKPSTFTPASHKHSADDINSGTLGVARGGTGTTTFTSGAVLIGNGTGAIQTRAIDTTSGGTSGSTSLITSGAVFAGLSGKANSSHGTHVTYGTAAPAAAGTASAGSAASVSRSDHVHPAQTSVSGNAGTATKLKNAVSIGLSGVTATAQEFDGSGDVTIPITAVPASIVSGLATVATSGKYSDLSGTPSIPSASSTTPKAAGTAAVGTGTTWARADHVHPAQTTITGNAGSATKVNSNLIIKLNGGTTEGTDLFTFNGSAAKTVNITPAGIGAATTSALSTHTSNTSNPHSVTKSQIGLGNVDNTADANKSVKYATSAGSAKTLDWVNDATSGSVTPLGASLSAEHSANRLAFLDPNALTIEYSNDGGSTWSNAGIADATKVGFVTTSGTLNIGSASSVTTNLKTRVTVTAQNGTTGYVYTRPRKLLLNVSTAGHGISVTIETKTGASGASWTTVGTYPLSGWSGWNDIPLAFATLGGGANQTTNIWYMRLTFSTTSVNSSYNTTKATVLGMRLFGDTCWTRTSNMGETGHLYSYDYQQNATFPAGVTATSFTGALSGNATSASKVNNNLIIKLNSGTTEGTNLFTFNGSGAKTVNITPSAIGAAASSHTHSYAGSSSAGGAANSVANSIIVKLNGGTSEGSTMFTFNGSAAKTINITPAGIGAAASSHGTHVSYGTAAPAAAGTASAGSASTVSRSDHVHPVQTTISGNAGSATKVNNSLIIKLNGGTTEGTDLFTFNGSAAKTINITPAAIGAAASSHGTHVSFGTAKPVVAGTAAVGTATTVSRSDHVHPAQTTVSGNAGTATKFAAAQSVALTGDVTGSASSQAGWSVATTLANSGVTAGSYGPSANASPAHSGTFSVPYITVDAKGRVTSASTKTITLPADNNTTYSPATLGFGRGTCSTAYATVAKAVTLSGYALVTGGMVAVQFTYGVPAGATLNVNSKGAKAIYHGTAAIKDGVIKAGDTATFVYNGTYYYLVSVASGSNTYTASITTTWSGSAAPYTQTITVSGMSANDNPIVDIVPDSDYDTAVEQMYEYNKIYRITTALNSITVYATEPTEVAIPIQLKCVKA